MRYSAACWRYVGDKMHNAALGSWLHGMFLITAVRPEMGVFVRQSVELDRLLRSQRRPCRIEHLHLLVFRQLIANHIGTHLPKSVTFLTGIPMPILVRLKQREGENMQARLTLLNICSGCVAGQLIEEGRPHTSLRDITRRRRMALVIPETSRNVLPFATELMQVFATSRKI